jgi:hypothetical protein
MGGYDMIIAVAFDGTLCVNEWPAIGAPRTAVIAWILARKQCGDKLILWTNRVGERLDGAVAWCREQGIEFDAVNENLPEIVQEFGGDCRKVFANVYLDDRAMKPEEAERQGRFARTVRRGR